MESLQDEVTQTIQETVARYLNRNPFLPVQMKDFQV